MDVRRQYEIKMERERESDEYYCKIVRLEITTVGLCYEEG